MCIAAFEVPQLRGWALPRLQGATGRGGGITPSNVVSTWRRSILLQLQSPCDKDVLYVFLLGVVYGSQGRIQLRNGVRLGVQNWLKVMGWSGCHGLGTGLGVDGRLFYTLRSLSMCVFAPTVLPLPPQVSQQPHPYAGFAYMCACTKG